MDVRIAIPDRHVAEGVLNAGLEAVTRLDEALIREGSAPTFDQAIKKGVKWAPEPPGQESFDHAAKVAARGWGDCDDLAPYRAGDLRAKGIDPHATAKVYPSGPGRWHAVVQRGDGRLEDPSRTAGMKVREGSRAAGIAPAVVGVMGGHVVGGGSVRPFVAVRRDSDGYLARVDVPVAGEAMALSCVQRGRSPSHALSGCMAGACMVGHASGMVDSGALDKMWATHQLMRGASLAEVVGVCGAAATKDALLTLQEIAPDLVKALRDHWDDAKVLRADLDRQRARKKEVGSATMSPYLEMRGGRTGRRAFGSEQAFRDPNVGAATQSPYLEMRGDPSWGTTPRRAFGSEQAFVDPNTQPGMSSVGWGTPDTSLWGRGQDVLYSLTDPHGWPSRLGHEKVVSPFAARYGHRGRQFVGAGLTPHLSFSLAGQHQRTHHHHPHGRAHRIVHGADLADAVDRALRSPPVGWDFFQDVVKPASHTVSQAASQAGKVVSDVSHGQFTSALSDAASIVDLSTVSKFAKDFISQAEGVISLVPGIGPGISAALSAGMALLEGGSPLDIAVKMAYGAIPIPPGVKAITDPLVDVALSLAHTKDLYDTGIAVARKAALDRLPGFAKDIGGFVFDTLAHLVLGAVHHQPTHSVVVPSAQKGAAPKVATVSLASHFALLAQQAVKQSTAKLAALKAVAPKTVKPAPAITKPQPVAIRPIAHVNLALKPKPVAPAVMAPLTLTTVVRTMRPQVIRHHIAVPKGVAV